MEEFKQKLNNYIAKTNTNEQSLITLAQIVNDNSIEETIDPPNPKQCIACCYNKQQCNKNKRKESQFCGVHIKGTPYGIMRKNDNIIKMEIILVEIKGIMCYIDGHNNIYKTEDIIQRKLNPTIIGKYTE